VRSLIDVDLFLCLVKQAAAQQIRELASGPNRNHPRNQQQIKPEPAASQRIKHCWIRWLAAGSGLIFQELLTPPVVHQTGTGSRPADQTGTTQPLAASKSNGNRTRQQGSPSRGSSNQPADEREPTKQQVSRSNGNQQPASGSNRNWQQPADQTEPAKQPVTDQMGTNGQQTKEEPATSQRIKQEQAASLCIEWEPLRQPSSQLNGNRTRKQGSEPNGNETASGPNGHQPGNKPADQT